MLTEDIFALGLGLHSPWKLKGQRFDIEKHPHELHLIIGADRGAQYPCPACNALCKAHDFLDMTWRHLNFFQHLCFLTVILRYWHSLLSNTRLEGMNGLFQAARARARGYRNQNNFIAMIYLIIGAPIAQTLWP